jgi:general secretion pathway protein C
LKNAASVATFAALALLGVVLAYWSWVWFGPAPAPRAPGAVETSGRTSSAAGLFRVAKGPGASAASGAIRLMGVAAASVEGRGRAVLRLDAKKTVSVLQGEDIEPGVRLVEVHADHIVVERNGARESLSWPERAGK